MDDHFLRDVVLIPLIMSIATGIYTGFLVSRILAFNQEFQRAMDRAFSCVTVFEKVINAETEIEAKGACAWLFFDITRALSAQPGQQATAVKIARLSLVTQEAMFAHWEKSKQYIRDGRPVDKYGEIVTGASHELVAATLRDIDKIKPNWGGLLFGSLWPQKRKIDLNF